MASSSNTEVIGDKKYTATYSVDSSGFGYSVITDDIKADFDFLTVDLPAKLDDIYKEIDSASAINDAFYFDGTCDISIARDELGRDINALKSSLTRLHQAFMDDIDSINAELEYNFGWIIIGSTKGSVRTENVENASSSGK